MTIGSTGTRILIAAIPVAAMLFIEVVLPRKNRRRDVSSRQDVFDQTQRDTAPAARDQARRDVASASCSRRGGHYNRLLYRMANTGDLASMGRLGEFALVRRDFVEAFYWKLMVELNHGRPSGLPAQGVCRAWQDAGCPESKTDEGGLFTESQAKLSMAVLDLWSGRHVHTPKALIRRLAEEGDRDAALCARCLGIGGA